VTLIVSIVLIAEGFISVLQSDVVGLAVYDVVNHVNPQAPIVAVFSAAALLYTYAQLQMATRR